MGVRGKAGVELMELCGIPALGIPKGTKFLILPLNWWENLSPDFSWIKPCPNSAREQELLEFHVICRGINPHSCCSAPSVAQNLGIPWAFSEIWEF